MKQLIMIYLLLIPACLMFSQSVPFSFNDPNYSSYLYQFDSLDENEVLEYEYDAFFIDGEDFNFKIFASNLYDDEKRLIGYWKVPYAGYQFSEDRRSMIFFNMPMTDEKTYPVYLIDGDEGNVRYLLNANLSGMSDKSLDYFLLTYPSDRNGIYSLALINLQKLRLERIINWELHSLQGGGLTIYRSLLQEYDFMIDYGVEIYIFATSYYDVKKDIFKVMYDKSNSRYEEAKPLRQLIPEEVGHNVNGLYF